MLLGLEGAFLNVSCKKRSRYVKDKRATTNRAWRLQKSLHGTKQAVHNFIEDLLKGLGFPQCKDGAGLYFRIADGSIGMDIGWSSSMVPITRAPAIKTLARD